MMRSQKSLEETTCEQGHTPFPPMMCLTKTLDTSASALPRSFGTFNNPLWPHQLNNWSTSGLNGPGVILGGFSEFMVVQGGSVVVPYRSSRF